MWQKDYEDSSSFISSKNKNYQSAQKLRIHDLYQKLKFSTLCSRLFNIIKDNNNIIKDYKVYPSNQGGLFKDNEEWRKQKKYICVNFTYFHSYPLLEINVHPGCKNDKVELYYTIQVQNNAYEHGVQVKRIPEVRYEPTEKGRGKGKDNIAKYVWENVLQKNDNHLDKYHGIIDGWMRISTYEWSDDCIFLSKDIIPDSKTKYNAYNMSDGAFLYQKRTIDEDASINDIIKKMLLDLHHIVQEVNKS